MKVNVNFICPEILGEMKNGAYDVSEGSTIMDLFKTCQNKNNIQVNQNYLKWLIVLANNKPAVWNTVLEPNSEVYILRGALGG